jgi:hypothetical protein
LEGSIGFVLRKFRVQEENGIGSNIDSDADLCCWRERADALPSAPGESVLNKIKKEISFINKGVITKEKPITPKVDLST